MRVPSGQTEPMAKFKRFISNYPLVSVTILVGLITLILWRTGNPVASQILATVYVGGVVAWTMVGMVKDMLAGNFGLDILAVVAMVATLAVGEYGASLIIVLMLTGGEALEDFAARRAKSELTSLLEQTPQSAHLLRDVNGQEEIEDIPADEVAVGNILLVRPGEVVPVDCVLLSPRGSFDESSITGESLPAKKIEGQEVPSGAINGDEVVRVRALRTTADSSYQQIIALVEEAQDSKAPVVRIADRFAVPFTLLALAIGGAAWAVSGDPVRFAEVLVLATPCPLLIAAPVAFLGGLSFSAKNGIIFKGGAVLESMSKVRSAAFDKTGTITSGQPQVVRVEPSEGTSKKQLLYVAGSAEQYSGHVLAPGIVSAARDKGVLLASSQKVEETPGQGVSADIDGKDVQVGSANFMGAALLDDQRPKLAPGEVAVYVSVDGAFAGYLVLADEIRPEAPAVIEYLRSEGVETVKMLTGDALGTAEVIAKEAGITDVMASLSPKEKVEAAADMEPRPALMVGDGVNDAPVLAAANVGIAMGARGATAAGEAADAVIVSDTLAKVADASAIAKHTMKVALTAIWIGILLSVGLMLIAATGRIPAMVGALTQEFVDLAAILYALRALKAKLPQLEVGQVDTHAIREEAAV